MKISEVNNLKSSSEVKKRRRVEGGGLFSDYLEAARAGETPATADTADVAATTALSNLLALQEISEYDVEREKMLKRGKNLLDSLEKLRREILMGGVPAQTLQELGRQLSLQRQQFDDPKLIEIIDDIELRAAVELAKLEMARKGGGVME